MTYDISSHAFLANPNPTLEQMRNEAPLVAVKFPFIGKAWLTTSDAAARALLKNPDVFVRDPKAITGKSLAQKMWFFPKFMQPLFGTMIAKDGAEHRRLRGLVDKAFARTSIADLRPEIQHIADDLVDRLDPDQPLDIMRHYARPLPLKAICALLGIPSEDRTRVAAMIAPLSGPTSKWAILRAFPGLYRTMKYFRADFARLRHTPRSGLINDLVALEHDGDRLSEDELLAMVVLLFIAGHETTVHLITMTILRLITDPVAKDRLQSDPKSLPLIIEEVMREAAPVMMTKPHFAACDTDICGMPVKKGDQIIALLIAANHDPARFETPQAFIPNRRPNAHIGFGHGPHVCLGMQLARAEAEIAVATLFARYPDMDLSDASMPPRYLRRVGIHSLQTLPVKLRP